MSQSTLARDFASLEAGELDLIVESSVFRDKALQLRVEALTLPRPRVATAQHLAQLCQGSLLPVNVARKLPHQALSPICHDGTILFHAYPCKSTLHNRVTLASRPKTTATASCVFVQYRIRQVPFARE